MIHFLKYRQLYFIISALVIIPGLISLARFGLRLGIDFTGGSRWEVEFRQEPDPERLKNFLEKEGVSVSSVVRSRERRFLIKAKAIDEAKRAETKGKMEKEFGSVTELRFEAVGPLLGQELLAKTVIGLIVSSFLILIYIAYQFRDRVFGICAVIATLHDSLVIIGSFSLLGHYLGYEVDSLFVTALLTILSFSVHDTIVVYDRIRESVKKFPGSSFELLVNKAINETLVRSLNNSLVVIFMLLCLTFLGGETIRAFSVALLIGTISGTYSSIFTAAPLLVIWKRRQLAPAA